MFEKNTYSSLMIRGVDLYMRQLQIGTTMIEYSLKFTKRKKTIGFHLDIHDGLSVYAPKYLSVDQVEQSLLKKSRWILKNMDKLGHVQQQLDQRMFCEGELFVLLGKPYRLHIHLEEKGTVFLEFLNGSFVATMPTSIPSDQYRLVLRPLFIMWYKQKAKRIINERVGQYLHFFSTQPQKIRVKDLKNKWGTCTGKNSISINWKLVFADMSIIDYVVVHELCHLEHKNHSKQFWDAVQKIVPEYLQAKKWLRIHGNTLCI